MGTGRRLVVRDRVGVARLRFASLLQPAVAEDGVGLVERVAEDRE